MFCASSKLSLFIVSCFAGISVYFWFVAVRRVQLYDEICFSVLEFSISSVSALQHQLHDREQICLRRVNKVFRPRKQRSCTHRRKAQKLLIGDHLHRRAVHT